MCLLYGAIGCDVRVERIYHHVLAKLHLNQRNVSSNVNRIGTKRTSLRTRAQNSRISNLFEDVSNSWELPLSKYWKHLLKLDKIQVGVVSDLIILTGISRRCRRRRWFGQIGQISALRSVSAPVPLCESVAFQRDHGTRNYLKRICCDTITFQLFYIPCRF